MSVLSFSTEEKGRGILTHYSGPNSIMDHCFRPTADPPETPGAPASRTPQQFDTSVPDPNASANVSPPFRTHFLPL